MAHSHLVPRLGWRSIPRRPPGNLFPDDGRCQALLLPRVRDRTPAPLCRQAEPANTRFVERTGQAWPLLFSIHAGACEGHLHQRLAVSVSGTTVPTATTARDDPTLLRVSVAAAKGRPVAHPLALWSHHATTAWPGRTVNSRPGPSPQVEDIVSLSSPYGESLCVGAIVLVGQPIAWPVIRARGCRRSSARSSTTSERGPMLRLFPGRSRPFAAGLAGSWVSITACHIAPGRVTGTVNRSGSHQALTSTRKSSSTMSVPSSARSGSSDPSR
jgi:hypothetical protein